MGGVAEYYNLPNISLKFAFIILSYSIHFTNRISLSLPHSLSLLLSFAHSLSLSLSLSICLSLSSIYKLFHRCTAHTLLIWLMSIAWIHTWNSIRCCTNLSIHLKRLFWDSNRFCEINIKSLLLLFNLLWPTYKVYFYSCGIEHGFPSCFSLSYPCLSLHIVADTEAKRWFNILPLKLLLLCIFYLLYIQ